MPENKHKFSQNRSLKDAGPLQNFASRGRKKGGFFHLPYCIPCLLDYFSFLHNIKQAIFAEQTIFLKNGQGNIKSLHSFR